MERWTNDFRHAYKIILILIACCRLEGEVGTDKSAYMLTGRLKKWFFVPALVVGSVTD